MTMQSKEKEKSEHHLSWGIAMMLGSIAIFAFQDILTAYLARKYPVPFFIMIRYWVFLLCATFIAMRAEGGLPKLLRTKRLKSQIVRALLLVLEIGVFALALRYLKLAELHSLLAAAPLLVTALSVPILGETVGWRRWIAVIIGSIGVIIIMRPGFGVFQLGALLGLSSAIMYALYVLLTRLVSRDDPFPTTYWYTAFIGTICMTVVGPFYWTIATPLDWVGISVLCISGITGHFFLIRALEYAPASLLQPLSHLQLVCATVLGFLFFSEIPDMITIGGALIIVSSGLYIVWREQQHKSQNKAGKT